jgi:choline monooxygenase
MKWMDLRIEAAYTLPSSFYRDPELFEKSKERIFQSSWQFIEHQSIIQGCGFVYPFLFLDPLVPEPLLMVQSDDDEIAIMSNVCTHRGNLVQTHAACLKELRCRYHGRSFDLNGCFKRMPQTKGMLDFPSQRDDLPKIPINKWKSLIFCSLSPEIPFDLWTQELDRRVSWMPMESFIAEPTAYQKFPVNAHWALYCDNYLEGFHIPFVHPELNAGIQMEDYETIPLDYGVLQIGIAREGDLCFELPSDSPDFGKKVAAYYFWLFPNIMLNFYPWGLSVNIVRPVDIKSSVIEFRDYVWKPELRRLGAGGSLDIVEMQDEEVVESVQQGIDSILYKRGRFSPNMEIGVHHFHCLLDQILNKK